MKRKSSAEILELLILEKERRATEVRRWDWVKGKAYNINEIRNLY